MLNGCHAFEAKFQTFLAIAFIEELLKIGTQLKFLPKYLLCVKRRMILFYFLYFSKIVKTSQKQLC